MMKRLTNTTMALLRIKRLKRAGVPSRLIHLHPIKGIPQTNFAELSDEEAAMYSMVDALLDQLLPLPKKCEPESTS